MLFIHICVLSNAGMVNIYRQPTNSKFFILINKLIASNSMASSRNRRISILAVTKKKIVCNNDIREKSRTYLHVRRIYGTKKKKTRHRKHIARCKKPE